MKQDSKLLNADISPEYVRECIDRASRVYDIAIDSPLDKAIGLSKRLKNTIYLKREDLQEVFSFKLRGAYNKMHQLSAPQRELGVITASAGNHAQGVALSAQRLGIAATIVMPKTTPEIKINSVKLWGASVILHGNSYDDAYIHACELASLMQLIFIHPYDDIDVIAGQGTIAKEILHAITGDLYAIFVPVGGGGLIAGIAAYVKSIRPEIKIIGVEPSDAACLHAALNDNERTSLDQVGLFADGVAVRQVGELPFEIAKQCVDDMLLVSTDEICAAIKDIFDDTRSITEPAGALAVAGAKRYLQQYSLENKNIICIASGANMNFDRLRHVAERAELGERREALYAVTIDEGAGSFLKFCKLVALRGITEFNYRFSDAKLAHIFVGVKLQGEQSELNEADKLAVEIIQAGYDVIDMTDNEMAKIHVRYMVGGRSHDVMNERLIRFEFPERPGALLRFLSNMGHNWNITLFHYRNHGAAFGRVLVGIQVPEHEQHDFAQFLEKIAYPYVDESDNPAYRLFLS